MGWFLSVVAPLPLLDWEIVLGTRRTKKGPGRRALSGQRHRFAQLRARGVSIRQAAREVGVSESAGKKWAFGGNVYRDGVLVRRIKPLEPALVAPISSRYLSEDERITIAELRQQGCSCRYIAQQLHRSPSTVSRELARNRIGETYHPFQAQKQAVLRRRRTRPRRLLQDSPLSVLVDRLLSIRWSPQQISDFLRTHYPSDPCMRVCHETIYQAVFHPGSRLGTQVKVEAAEAATPLRTGRSSRRAHRRGYGQRCRFEQPMLSIHQRPFLPEDRCEPGHWEGDLIVGRHGKSAMATLVERSSRFVVLVKITARDSGAVTSAVAAAFGAVPPAMRKSLTWDQGQEMARHKNFSETVRMPVYFCDPHSPWQRGSNENTNGLLR